MKNAWIIGSLILANSAWAQLSVNIGGQVGLPQGDFKEQTSD